jgi:hypothetical protein
MNRAVDVEASGEQHVDNAKTRKLVRKMKKSAVDFISMSLKSNCLRQSTIARLARCCTQLHRRRGRWVEACAKHAHKSVVVNVVVLHCGFTFIDRELHSCFLKCFTHTQRATQNETAPTIPVAQTCSPESHTSPAHSNAATCRPMQTCNARARNSCFCRSINQAQRRAFMSQEINFIGQPSPTRSHRLRSQLPSRVGGAQQCLHAKAEAGGDVKVNTASRDKRCRFA